MQVIYLNQRLLPAKLNMMSLYCWHKVYFFKIKLSRQNPKIITLRYYLSNHKISNENEVMNTIVEYLRKKIF